MRRRALIGGGVAAAAALGAGAWYERRKLSGAYDFSERLAPTAPEKWAASLKTIESDPLAADGAIVHVGQSTHLIAIGGRRLLTDPWFHDPAFGAMAHARGPAVAPGGVGPLDWILVTHDHADHADPKALDRLDKRAFVLCSDEPLAAKIRKLGFTAVEVMKEWETIEAKGLSITATPAVHDIHEIGFVVRSTLHSIYFAGDTSARAPFREIRERLAPTFAILPCDGTRLIGGESWVMDPQEAAAAARELGVSGAMPSHADAYFSDPLVAAGLASTIEGANELFVKAAGDAGLRADNPAPGAIVPLLAAA